jgi:hypothetical protein
MRFNPCFPWRIQVCNSRFVERRIVSKSEDDLPIVARM